MTGPSLLEKLDAAINRARADRAAQQVPEPDQDTEAPTETTDAPTEERTRAVLRWSVPVDDAFHLIGYGRVVHVGVAPQHAGRVDVVNVWTEEEGRPNVNRPARVFGTGQPLPEDAEHLGSVVLTSLVWHVYEVIGDPS